MGGTTVGSRQGVKRRKSDRTCRKNALSAADGGLHSRSSPAVGWPGGARQTFKWLRSCIDLPLEELSVLRGGDPGRCDRLQALRPGPSVTGRAWLRSCFGWRIEKRNVTQHSALGDRGVGPRGCP